MQGNVPGLTRSHCKANNEAKGADKLKLGLRCGLVVQNEALAHEAVLVSLVLARDQYREHTGAELLGHVLHDFAVGAASIDTALSLEVGAEGALVHPILAEDLLPVLFVFLFEPAKQLCEHCVALTRVYLAIQGELRRLKAREFNSDLFAFLIPFVGFFE